MGKSWSVEALRVLSIIAGGRELHGYAIAREAQMPRTSAYTILKRFEEDGLVTSKTERVSHLAPRVPKVVYAGTTCAADELQHIREIVGA